MQARDQTNFTFLRPRSEKKKRNCPPTWKQSNAMCLGINSKQKEEHYFFFLPPVPPTRFSTALMTPTATVWRISRTTKRRVLGEGLDAHRLLRDQDDNGGVARLDGARGVLDDLTRTAVDLLDQLLELAGNVSRVAIQDRRVASRDLTGVVEDDDLGGEVSGLHRRVVLRVTSDHAAADVLDGHRLDVEANVVTREGLVHGLVVHLHRLDLSGDVGEGAEKGGTLPPRHVVRLLEHVVAVPARDRD